MGKKASSKAKLGNGRRNLQCKVISDSMVDYLDNGAFVRRCGIKFGNLSDKKKTQLSTFVQEYVTDSETSKPWHIEFA